MKKINLEYEYLKVNFRNTSSIMELFKKRNQLRSQLDIKNFDYKMNKKIYLAITNVNLELSKILESYHRKYRKEIVYKGVDLNDVIPFC